MERKLGIKEQDKRRKKVSVILRREKAFEVALGAKDQVCLD